MTFKEQNMCLLQRVYALQVTIRKEEFKHVEDVAFQHVAQLSVLPLAAQQLLVHQR